jgi:hypothetical protein
MTGEEQWVFASDFDRLRAELEGANKRVAAYDAAMAAVREKGLLDKVMEALGDKGIYKIFNQGWDGCIEAIDATMKEQKP